ncbi:hypothetical protein O206_19760 [Ochrobactrum sp. EGD-AQ16]|uniref:ester cyclase n=1 Tax=Brucella intermedia TaxID=94625 RepID=UPI0003983FE0|nr:ester cyclase [Brucella intermedia]ERI15315.1 hypothetical protein O206_19760 [Ochrobactrum sp. EGD-AQ16]
MGKLTFAAGALVTLTAQGPHNAAEQTINPTDAVAIVMPLYQALTASTADEVRARVEGVTAPDWQNCGRNDGCETREATIARWSARVARLPDFRFDVKEILVSGNRIIVRSEATGSPTEPFMDVVPQGHSFAIMTLDVHEINVGKIVRTYHVEDWQRAARQLRGEQ